MAEDQNAENCLVNLLKNLSCDLKQNVLTNCPIPSLEYLVLSKLAIFLWKEEIEKSGDYNIYFGCPDEMKILNKIFNLLIPKQCKEDLIQMVKLTGSELANIFVRKELNKISKLKLHLNLFWNLQGTINYLKTVQNVIKDTNLSTLEKYELACDFCLKDSIRDLQKNLSKSDIKYIETKKNHSWTIFWLLYYKNSETVPAIIKGYPALDYLKRYLMVCKNDVAIHYIWENFADDSWKELITHILIQISGYPSYYLLYFFRQMSHSQLKEASLMAYDDLLSKLFFISKWNKDLSLPKYASEVFKIRKFYYNAFRMVKFCWNIIFPNLEDCINIWNEFATRFKSDLEMNICFLYEESLNVIVSPFKQGIFAKLLLNVANSGLRETLLYSRKTILKCRSLLCEEKKGGPLFDGFPSQDGLQSFEVFTKLILKENEICQFEKKFFQVEKMNICSKLIFDQNYKLLDKILVKFYAKEISEFKKKYCISILRSLLKKFKRDSVELLSVVVSFLEWCLDDKNEIKRYNDLMSDLDSTLHYCRRNQLAIMWGKWILVRKYWKFILCRWKRENTNSTEKSLSCLKKKNCDGLLKRVIIACFNPDEEKELQKELQYNDDLLLHVKELIEIKAVPEVDGLLSWCFSSDESKIYAYKTTFMNQFGCKLLFRFIEIDDYEEVKSILSWFNPSVTLAKEFRAKFKTFVSNLTETNINNGGCDRKVRRENENIKKVLSERIRKSLELLNCYIKENCLSEKEKDTVHSKKRKMTEKKRPIRKNKKTKISI